MGYTSKFRDFSEGSLGIIRFSKSILDILNIFIAISIILHMTLF